MNSIIRSDSFWKSSLVRGWKDIRESSSEDVPIYQLFIKSVSWKWVWKAKIAHLPVQLLQEGPQRCWGQLSARVPCLAEPFLEDQGEHQNRRNHRNRRHQNPSSKFFAPPFQQVLLSRSLSSSAAQQGLEPPPQTLLLKVPPSRSNVTIISQHYRLYVRWTDHWGVFLFIFSIPFRSNDSRFLRHRRWCRGSLSWCSLRGFSFHRGLKKKNFLCRFHKKTYPIHLPVTW